MITGLDFTDDRLTLLLEKLSDEERWARIETELGKHTIRAYELGVRQVRLDATTVSGYHRGTEDGLFQYGHSKDDPTLRQVKVMVAALDPLGMPLVTEMVEGNRADDPLYLPAVDRVLEVVGAREVVFVGDCKLGSEGNRAAIVARRQHYLCPVAKVGETATLLEGWIEDAVSGKERMERVYGVGEEGEEGEEIAVGYSLTRTMLVEVEGKEQRWKEQVVVVRSEGMRRRQEESLEGRLAKAMAELVALTPEEGRGRRQIREEAALQEAVKRVLQAREVEGLVRWSFERQEDRRVRYEGPGRGGTTRVRRDDEVRVRYQIRGIERDEAAITAKKARLGWRAYVTSVGKDQMGVAAVVQSYRDEWLIERGFHRLKGAPLSLDPMYVKRDDQVRGLTNLLSLGVRMLTLVEYVVRRELKARGDVLAGLLPSNPKKGIDNPTTERLLKVFEGVTLTVVRIQGQELWHVTPLTGLQMKILDLLGLDPAVYLGLAENPG